MHQWMCNAYDHAHACRGGNTIVFLIYGKLNNTEQW